MVRVAGWKNGRLKREEDLSAAFLEVTSFWRSIAMVCASHMPWSSKGGKPKTSSSPFCYPNVLVGPLNKFRMTGRRIPTAFMLRCDVYMPRRSSSRPTMLLKFAAFLFFNCYNIRPMFNTCIYRVNVTLRKSCRLYMHRTVTVRQKRSSILEHIRDLIIGWDYVATFFPMQLTTWLGALSANDMNLRRVGSPLLNCRDYRKRD